MVASRGTPARSGPKGGGLTTIARVMAGRRAGDPGALISDPSRIKATLPWRPEHADLDTIVAHAVQWERKLAARRGGA